MTESTEIISIRTIGKMRMTFGCLHVAGGGARAVDQAALAIHADVQLHAKVPLVTLLALVHLRVALAGGVLGRGRCRDQRGIDNRSTGEFHPVGQQQLVDLGEEHCAKPVFLKKKAEIEQRGGIGRSLAA